MNGYNFLIIPYLNIIETHLRQSTKDQNKLKSISYDLEQLPYSINGAFNTISELKNIYESTLKNFKEYDLKPGKIQQLDTEISCRMGNHIDNYLTYGRIIQNVLCRYISRVLRISIPQSMNDLIKNLLSKKIKLPDPFNEILFSYWNKDGKKLKEYRDFSLHFGVISSDASIVMNHKKEIIIHLVLPNNPDVKNVSKLIYQDPSIDGFSYCFNSFLMLYETVYKIIFLLAHKAGKPKNFIHSKMFKAPSIIDYFKVDVNALKKNLEEEIEELKVKTDNYLKSNYGEIK